METDQRRAAKAQMIADMLRGQPWHAAATAAGLQTSRTAAYRVRHAVQEVGEVALQDRRHGHPSKMRHAVCQWLEMYCRGAPATSGRAVQGALYERFGLHVSVRHINHMRAVLGVSRRSSGVGGKSKPPRVA